MNFLKLFPRIRECLLLLRDSLDEIAISKIFYDNVVTARFLVSNIWHQYKFFQSTIMYMNIRSFTQNIGKIIKLSTSQNGKF